MSSEGHDMSAAMVVVSPCDVQALDLEFHG